jgi:hypothetical protein
MRWKFSKVFTERSFHSSLDEVPSMKRSMWGITLIAAAAGLWSCNGDPTGDLRAGERIIADPASVFLDEGATKFVTVELVDGQGNQLATDFTAGSVAGGITVAEDPTFLETTINTRLPTQERFVVTGLTPSVSSFVVTAGDTSLTVPVRVLPTFFAATFSNAAPVQNEVITVTAPAGFSFAAVSGVVVGGDTGVVVGHAVDGTSFTFVARPGLDTLPATNVVTVIGATSGLYPSVPLTLPSVDVMTVQPAAAIAGTGTQGSAPTFPAPVVGAVTAFFDKGTFTGADVIGAGGSGGQYYKIVVAEAGDYNISVGWDGATDLQAFVCPSADPTCAASGFTLGSGTANPKASILTLTPDTYLLNVISFHDPLAPETIPPRIGVTVTRL